MELTELVIGKSNLINVKNYIDSRRTKVINNKNVKLAKEMNDISIMLEQSLAVMCRLEEELKKYKREYFNLSTEIESLEMENAELSRVNNNLKNGL